MESENFQTPQLAKSSATIMTTTTEEQLHKQSELHKLLTAMIVLPSLIVCLRFWSRALLPNGAASKTAFSRKFWWDDWSVLVAAMLNIALCGIGIKMVSLGMGRHITNTPPQNVSPFLKLLWIDCLIFGFSTALTRSSALFFYARIFGVVEDWFRYSLWLVHALNISWLTAVNLVVILQCKPVERAWNLGPGKCVDMQAVWLGSGITALIIDVVILLLPLPILWGLRLKLLRKIQVVSVFVCGYLVVVASMGRLISTVLARKAMQLDPTFKVATPVLWIDSETAVSIISVSLPSLLFLVQKARNEGIVSLFRSIRSGKSGSKLVDSNEIRDLHGYAKGGSDHNAIGDSNHFHHAYPVPSSSSELMTKNSLATERCDGSNDEYKNSNSLCIHVRSEFSVSNTKGTAI